MQSPCDSNPMYTELGLLPTSQSWRNSVNPFSKVAVSSDSSINASSAAGSIPGNGNHSETFSSMAFERARAVSSFLSIKILGALKIQSPGPQVHPKTKKSRVGPWPNMTWPDMIQADVKLEALNFEHENNKERPRLRLRLIDLDFTLKFR